MEASPAKSWLGDMSPELNGDRASLASVDSGSRKRKLPGLTPPSHRRKPSLRQARDSSEQLKTQTRARGLFGGDSQLATAFTAGRAGRQFTVGNIGNNGIIYLRYVPTLGDPVTRRGTLQTFFPEYV